MQMEAFRAEDRLLLSLIALCASQCTAARSAEVVLDALLMPPAEPSASPTEPQAGAGGLSERYPEVRVLMHLHHLRCALRDLQECPAHARRTFVLILHEHLVGLASVLPDPLFSAIAILLQRRLAADTDESLAKSDRHVLETQLAEVVEATQTELLRATKQLTARAGIVTLRFHHDIPLL